MSVIDKIDDKIASDKLESTQSMKIIYSLIRGLPN